MFGPLPVHHQTQGDQGTPQTQDDGQPEPERSRPCRPGNVPQADVLARFPQPLNKSVQGTIFVHTRIGQHERGTKLQHLVLPPAGLGAHIVMRQHQRVGERAQQTGSGNAAGRQRQHQDDGQFLAAESKTLQQRIDQRDRDDQHTIDRDRHVVADQIGLLQHLIVEIAEAANGRSAQQPQNDGPYGHGCRSSKIRSKADGPGAPLSSISTSMSRNPLSRNQRPTWNRIGAPASVSRDTDRQSAAADIAAIAPLLRTRAASKQSETGSNGARQPIPLFQSRSGLNTKR